MNVTGTRQWRDKRATRRCVQQRPSLQNYCRSFSHILILQRSVAHFSFVRDGLYVLNPIFCSSNKGLRLHEMTLCGRSYVQGNILFYFKIKDLIVSILNWLRITTSPDIVLKIWKKNAESNAWSMCVKALPNVLMFAFEAPCSQQWARRIRKRRRSEWRNGQPCLRSGLLARNRFPLPRFIRSS